MSWETRWISVPHRCCRPTGDETVALASRPAVARASSPAHEDVRDTLLLLGHDLTRRGERKNSPQPRFVSGHDFTAWRKTFLTQALYQGTTSQPGERLF